MGSGFWQHLWNKQHSKHDTSLESSRTRDLESQINRITARQQEAAHESCVRDRKIVEAQRQRRRIADIRVRDKERSILVVPLDENRSQLSQSLIEANPSARVVYASDLDDGLEIFEAHAFDMVYLVVDMRDESTLYGPCFASTSLPEDESSRLQIKGLIERIQPVIDKFSPPAEVIIVCGTDEMYCPLVEHLYVEPGRSGIFNV